MMIQETHVRYIAHSLCWSQHFEKNLNHMSRVPWKDEVILDGQQKNAIAKSIATFQLGENSEGNSFRRAGKKYAEETGDVEYLNALDMFIKEENRHSDVLARFMKSQAIAKLEQEWTDDIFRWIRKLAGLNICISVLLTAEIIAAVYYRALGQATHSPVLKAICDQILIDEAHHLVFQAGTLAKQRRKWSKPRRWLSSLTQQFLMLGTILIVWREHRQVYLAGGYSFLGMARETWEVFRETLQLIHDATLSDLPLPNDTRIPRPIQDVKIGFVQ